MKLNKVRFIYKVLLKKIYKRYGLVATLNYIDSMSTINDDLKVQFKDYVYKLQKK